MAKLRKRKIIKMAKKVQKRRIVKAAKRRLPSRKATARRRKVLVVNPTKARRRILTGPSQSRRRRVWSGKLAVKKAKKTRKTKKISKVKKSVFSRGVKKHTVKKSAVRKVKAVKRLAKRPAKRRKHLGGSATISAKQNLGGFAAEALFKAKIKVIGIGGGGGSIVSEIGRSLEKATFVIADTDIRALKKKSGIKYFWFGEELTHGLGTGVNVDLAKQAAESAKEKISQFFKDQDIIIFVASLGGGLGSGATQVFAEAAKSFGGITFGIFTMPFRFEGKNKYRVAQNALKALRKSLNVSLVIPNEKIFKVIDSSTPITNAFSTVNKSLIGSLESLIDLIYNPGIINIDFADLRTILRGRGNSAFLNTVEESGKDRVEKICESVFKNPLLQNNGFKAEKILFDIAGSETLSMFEVEKISSHIANLNPKAKIIFGISKDAKLKSKIKTTILMTGGAGGEEAEPEKARKPDKSPVGHFDGPATISPKASLGGKSKAKKHKSSRKKPVSFIPIPEVSTPGYPSGLPVLEQARLGVSQMESVPVKKAIRRSGLEIKKAEELEEKKKIAQEKEWEIPAFLRKIKFRN